MSISNNLPKISRAVSDDAELDDVVAMAQIVARQRVLAAITKDMGAAEDFALGVLCILLDHLKTDTYRSQVSILRSLFRGIASDSDLQSSFKESLARDLIRAKGVEDVVKQGVERMFHLQLSGGTP